MTTFQLTRRLLASALLLPCLALPALAQDKAPRVKLATSQGDIVIRSSICTFGAISSIRSAICAMLTVPSEA